MVMAWNPSPRSLDSQQLLRRSHSPAATAVRMDEGNPITPNLPAATDGGQCPSPADGNVSEYALDQKLCPPGWESIGLPG